MAVEFDAMGTGVYYNSTSPYDFTTLTVGAGSNRVLVVQIEGDRSDGEGGGYLTLTWDPAGANQSLSLIKKETIGGEWVQLWGLVAPASGNKTLRVAWDTGTAQLKFQAVAFTGADQTGGATTFPNATSNAGSSGTTSVTVTSAVGNMAVSHHAGFDDQSAPTQTQTYLIQTGSASGCGQYAAGAASVVFQTTINTNTWTVVGCDILAAGGGGGGDGLMWLA